LWVGESSFSGRKIDLLQELGDGVFEPLQRGAGTANRLRVELQGQARTESTGLEADVELRDDSAELGHAITVGMGDALEKAVEAKPSEVMRHLSWPICIAIAAQELSDSVTQLTVTEVCRLQREDGERLHQGQDSPVTEPKPRSTLAADNDRFGHGAEPTLPDQAVMAQGLGAHRRRLASKPIFRRAERLLSDLPIWKS
jgi:hypothetical protein